MFGTQFFGQNYFAEISGLFSAPPVTPESGAGGPEKLDSYRFDAAEEHELIDVLTVWLSVK